MSWGGALAQEMARHGGDRVRRLVLCATAAGGLTVPGDPRVLAILATPLRYWSPTYLDRVAPALYGPEVAGNPEHDGPPAPGPVHPGAVGAGLRVADAGPAPLRQRPVAPPAGQPTLVLAGESDPIVPVANGRILANRIPNARLEVVEGGHLFLLTHAGPMAARINDFLDEP